MSRMRRRLVWSLAIALVGAARASHDVDVSGKTRDTFKHLHADRGEEHRKVLSDFTAPERKRDPEREGARSEDDGRSLTKESKPRWNRGDHVDLVPTIELIQHKGRRHLEQQDDQQQADDDEDAIANRLCSEYLVSFLEGTTDAKDTCEGIGNAYHAADCSTTLSGTTAYDGSDEDDYFGEFYEHMCCASLQTHLSQYCEENRLITNMHLLLVTSVLLLCECAKSVVKKNDINFLPEAAVCILVGTFCGLVAHFMPGSGIDDMSFDDEIFMSVLLPPIIFEAAISVSKPQFRRRRGAIFMMAVVGTVLSSFMTGLMVHFASKYSNAMTVPMLDSLIYGTLISSIDPVAILSVLSSLNMNQTDMIFILVFGESLLNDGVAITLFQSLVERGAWGENGGITLTTDEIFGAVADFFIVAFGSIGVGLACGVLALVYFWMFQHVLHPVMEVGSFFIWALIPYYISDGVEWSGIVAIVVMGFFMDLYIASPQSALSDGGDGSEAGSQGDFYMNFEEHHTPSADLCEEPCGHGRTLLQINLPQLLSGSERVRLSPEADKHVRFVAHLLSALSENAIFAYLGLFLLSNNYNWNVTLCLIGIASCILSRALMVIIVCWLFYHLHRLRLRHDKKNAERKALRYGRPVPDIRLSRTAEQLQDKKIQFVLVLSGLRGAVSLALMEDVPIYNSVTGEGCEFKPLLKAMTSSSIIFTTFVFGGGAYYILPHMGIHPHTEDGHHGHEGSGSDLSSTQPTPENRDNGTSPPAASPKKKLKIEMSKWRWTLCHYDRDDLDTSMKADNEGILEVPVVPYTPSQAPGAPLQTPLSVIDNAGLSGSHIFTDKSREKARNMPSIIS